MIARTSVTSVTGASVVGKVQKLVTWVNRAYRNIQLTRRREWLWLRTQFTSPATASGGTGRYTGTGWGLTRFGVWVPDRERDDGSLFSSQTIYLQATGVSGQGALRQITWEQWLERYGRGTQTENAPTEWAISPSGEFCLGPIPDGAYIIKGEYMKGAQDLTADGDEPEMPEDFHDLIMYDALVLMNKAGEAPRDVILNNKEERARLWQMLEIDQLPEVTVATGGML